MQNANHTYFNVVETAKIVYQLLNPKQHKRLFAILWATTLGSLFEVFGLVSVVPVLFLAVNPKILNSNTSIQFIKQHSTFLSHNPNLLTTMMGVVVLLFVMKNAYHVWLIRCQSQFAYGFSTDLTQRSISFFFESSIQDNQRLDSGKMFNISTNIPDNFARNIILTLILLVAETLVLAVVLMALLLFNWKVFAMIICIIAPIMLVFLTWNKQHLQAISYKKNLLSNQIIKNIIQTIRAYIDIKLLQKEQFITQKITNQRRQQNAYSADHELLTALPLRVVETVSILCIFIIFVYTMQFGADSSILLPLLGVYAAAAYRIMPSVNRILGGLMKIKTFQSTIFEVKNRFIDQIKTAQKLKINTKNELNHAPMDFKHSVRLQNISFSHNNDNDNADTKPIFNDFDLTIQKGQHIGIVGQSGQGKTTLGLILLGFYTPQKGQITIDNTQTIDQQNLIGYQKLFAYVRQDVFIVDGTIAQNIAFGVEPQQIDQPLLQKSISQAAMSQWIDSLSQKEHTPLNEQGSNISGGQRQRIAIARALYRNAQILILDEATASLDAQNEQEIIQTIRHLQHHEGKTIVSITHKKEILKYCDTIISL